MIEANINSLIAYAESYGVSPIIFLFLYLVSIPFYYWPILRIRKLYRNLHKKDLKTFKSELALSIIVNRLAWAMPLIYVVVFGRGLPAWIKAVIIFYMIIGTFYFTYKLRKGKNLCRLQSQKVQEKV